MSKNNRALKRAALFPSLIGVKVNVDLLAGGCASRGYLSPNHILWNKKQDITQLQTFGAMVEVVKTPPKKSNARLNEKDPIQVLTNATPGFLVGYQSWFFNGCKKILTLQGNIVHSLDVYFRDNDPRDPHDVNPRIFLHPFDGFGP